MDRLVACRIHGVTARGVGGRRRLFGSAFPEELERGHSVHLENF
jgi:hypothetical protein